jgi:hypothetical protein
MNRYRIHYRDKDPCCPVFRCIIRAYNREHAEEKFWEADPNDMDWTLIKIERI